MKPKNASLSRWVDSLQSSGLYSFTRGKAKDETDLNDENLKKSLLRLHNQGRILRLRNSFYIIVPLEYRSAGTVPPEWFVNDLMNFIGVPYYVGCLSAAALYGAAHQRPQELQVVVPSHVRMIDLPSVRIRFLQYAGMENTGTGLRRTQTGDYTISTPEWTTIDLLRFQKYVGGLDAVAEILQELDEAIEVGKLADACRQEKQNAPLQRLGWVLECLGNDRLMQTVLTEVERRNPSYVSLNPAVKKRSGTHNSLWRVIVNDTLEAGL
jgi:predicted transcriptional regulator of viral defense system